jgi:hypothetical protein
VFLPLTAYGRLHSGSRVVGGYGSGLAAGWSSAAAILKVMTENLSAMAEALSYIVMPLLGTKLAAAFPKAAGVVQLGAGLIVLLGTIRLIQVSRRRDLPAWTHALATLGVFLVWPWTFGPRFILSLFPLILCAFGAWGSVRLRRWGLPSRLGRRLGMLALALTAASSMSLTARVVWQAHRRGGLWEDPAAYASLDATLNVIRTRLETNAVVVSMMPELVYLYTGRQGVLLLEDDDRVLRRLGRRDPLETAMAEVPGRPFYLLSAPPDSSPDLDAQQAAAFGRDPALVVQEVYRSPDGRYWLGQVSSRNPHAPTRVDQ